MTDIVGSSNKIQVEACDHNSPLSEDLLTKIGAGINYVLDAWSSIPVNYINIVSTGLGTSSPSSLSCNFIAPYDMNIVGLDFSLYSRDSFTAGGATLTTTYTVTVTHNSSTVCSFSSSKTFTDGSIYLFFENKKVSIYGNYGVTPSTGITSPVSVLAGETITISISASTNSYAGYLAYEPKLMIVKSL